MPTTSLLPGTENYDHAIAELAGEHAHHHNVLGDLTIFSLPDPKKQVVQLIEVSDSFPESDDLWPVRMRATSDFPFESAVLIATRNEWTRVLKGSLQVLHCDWDFSQRQKVFPN